MGLVVAIGLLLANASDEEFLAERLDDLERRYARLESRQSRDGIAERAAILRELAHLPFAGPPRRAAGAFLARVIAAERPYHLRAEAARAIGRVGTGPALDALYRTLFGPAGRERSYALLHTLLPDVVARLGHRDDHAWLAARVLRPAEAGLATPLTRAAGPLSDEMVALTLEGVARGRIAALLPKARALAGDERPAVRAAALRALGELGAGGDELVAALSAAEPEVRRAAAAAPGLPGAARARVLGDADPLVRRAAVRGLARRGGSDAIDVLIDRLATEEDPPVRLELREALHALTGRDFGDDVALWRPWWEAQRGGFSGRQEAEDRRAYFFEVPLRTRRVLFLVDVSSSMAREDEERVSRLERAAKELGATLRRLPPGARFVLTTFSSTVDRHPAEGSLDPGAEAAQAVETLRSKIPGGATNTYGALMEALHDPFAPDTVVLLTDGLPYRCAWKGKTYDEPEQIRAEVRRANAGRGVRIHAVALLTGVFDPGEEEEGERAARFLRELAAENGGHFREER